MEVRIPSHLLHRTHALQPMGANMSRGRPSLSARRSTRNTLPPKPPSVCEECWRGPFSAHLGLFQAPIKRDQEEERAPFRGGRSYFTSPLQLEHRAAAGCVWCELLRATYGRKHFHIIPRPDGRLKITVGVQQLKVSPGSSPANSQGLVVVINDTTRLFTRLLHTLADDAATPYIVARSPVLDVGSLRALALARSLIEVCVSGHERCIQVSPSCDVPLPTRLVDCTDPSRPRLVTTAGRHGRFLALSYVWGEAQPHRTVMENVAAYADGIGRLPQTICDAIHVTRSLGFRYLWVDSLCIIQDSDEDKMHELGHMHLIYRTAYVTIVAASAERVGEGFLQDRPAKTDDVTLPFPCLSSAPGERVAGRRQVLIGKLCTTSLSATDDGGILSGGDSAWEPIHERGWCLQELYMSPRALIFTSDTMRLRCQHTTQNIGNSFYHPISAEVRLPDVLFHREVPPSRPIPVGSAEWTSVHRVWCKIVHQYTRRTVSNASDKLVACGALAEAFHRVLGSDYLAGLWRDTLLQDLLWIKMEDDSARRLRLQLGGPLDRPMEFRAPSWSWAAVEGVVRMRTATEFVGGRAIAAVVRCEVALKLQELPFGEVTDGVLVLRAALVQPRCTLHFGDWKDGGVLSSSRLARRLGRRHDSSAYENHSILEDGTLLGWCTVDHAADRRIASDRAWLVPLLWDEFLSDVLGLIVAPANRESASGVQGKQVYRRIGQFCADADSWDALWQSGGPLPLVEVEIV